MIHDLETHDLQAAVVWINEPVGYSESDIPLFEIKEYAAGSHYGWNFSCGKYVGDTTKNCSVGYLNTPTRCAYAITGNLGVLRIRRAKSSKQKTKTIKRPVQLLISIHLRKCE